MFNGGKGIILNENMGLLCPQCAFEYMHTLGVMEIKAIDSKIIKITVNGINIPFEENFRHIPFRSQSSTHILFTCENGHFSFLSLDGHKGNVYVNSNETIDELARFLNKRNKDTEYNELRMTYILLGQIEKFFNV